MTKAERAKLHQDLEDVLDKTATSEEYINFLSRIAGALVACRDANARRARLSRGKAPRTGTAQ